VDAYAGTGPAAALEGADAVIDTINIWSADQAEMKLSNPIGMYTF
jgi:hypothetical protein